MRIAVEGLIGVGKSTFVSEFADITGVKPLFESVDDNPFLEPFFQDPERWAYTLQSYFLYRRYKDHTTEGNIILDRSLYGDICFANMLYKDGTLTQSEYDCYITHYQTLEPLLPPIDLCIILNTSPEVALSRVRKRDRDFETDLSLEYLRNLSSEIDLIPSRLRAETKVIQLDWGEMTGNEISKKCGEIVRSYFLGFFP
tara:strand:- start:1006 stop:1602 length:597 start_codon:yes stop_codon:yes gene_type:complete